MLEEEGFEYDRYVDVFDGGPTVTAATDDVRSISTAAARTVDALIEAIGEALKSIRVGDIQGWFRHSGYRTDSSTITVNEKPL